MALRTAGGTDPASDQIHRLASFLAALTGQRTPAQIHAAITEQLTREGHDHRIDGVAANLDEFSTLWSQLTDGALVPQMTWQKVILPSILVFSNEQALKANLEWATSHWLAIADTERAQLLADRVAVLNDLTTVQLMLDTAQATVPIRSAPPPQPTAATQVSLGNPGSGLDRRSRFAVGAALIVLVLVLGAAAWQLTRSDPSNKPVALPSPPAVASGQQLSAEPSSFTDTGAAPSPAATAPAPAPTWAGTGQVVKPAAPQQLLVIDATALSVALRWDPPIDHGGAAIAYFRIHRDGVDAGWTSQTAVTIGGLQPGTRYTFAVVAYNAAGLASVFSSTVWAVTLAADRVSGQTLATTPASPIALGEPFSVNGSGRPCTMPAQVRISLGGHPVAVTPLSANGTYSTTIVFTVFDKVRPELPIIGGTEPLKLGPGSVVLATELDGQPQCATFGVETLRVVLR